MKKAVILSLLLHACGHHKDEPESEAFKSIKPIIASNCEVAGCHDGNTQQKFPEQRFKSSRAQERIKDNSMPLGRKLNANDKQALLNYFAAQ